MTPQTTQTHYFIVLIKALVAKVCASWMFPSLTLSWNAHGISFTVVFIAEITQTDISKVSQIWRHLERRRFSRLCRRTISTK